MPDQLELSDLQLVYLNGQEHGGAPVFKDVRLTKDGNKLCETLLAAAAAHDKRIRSESELEQVLEVEVALRNCMTKLELLKADEREPWNKILSQISTAVGGMVTQMQLVSGKLKKRIEAWRAEVAEGQRKEAERLEEEARRADLKAEYADNPVAKRQARVAAKQYREEAKKHAPKPAKGLDTVEYYEIEIVNRHLAAKLPEEAITMEVNEKWFTDRIRAAKANKQPMPTFDGINVVTKTRVRIHR